MVSSETVQASQVEEMVSPKRANEKARAAALQAEQKKPRLYDIYVKCSLKLGGNNDYLMVG